MLEDRAGDLSEYKAWYPPPPTTKYGVRLPRQSKHYTDFIEGDNRRLMGLLNVIEAATDKESIDSIVQKRDFLEERMNASYWAFVAAEWEANQIIKWYDKFLYRKAIETRREGREIGRDAMKEAKTLLKVMRKARIPSVTRIVQGYRDLQLHHQMELYAVGMVALTTSTVGLAAGLLPPIGEVIPPLANLEPFKFLGGAFWGFVTGIGMYALTTAGPQTVAKLRSRGRYVQV